MASMRKILMTLHKRQQSLPVFTALRMGGFATPSLFPVARPFSSLGRIGIAMGNKLTCTPPPWRIPGGYRGAHDQRTKGDEELLGFLSEEISTEKKLQRTTTLPSNISGFSVTLDKAEVTLTKTHGTEEITISANVNHSVDADFAEDPNNVKQASKDGADEMRSRPNFDVEIKRGSEVMSFTCSFIQATPEGDSQEEFNDLFAIDEVCMYDKEWEDKEYSVAGDILDGYLYDLFMNMLEERGVTNEVVDKFSDLCTDYEHSLYVDLLVKLQQFLEKK